MWLKDIRISAGLTQLEVAKTLGIHRASFSKIETGKMTPSVPLAKNIGVLFDFDWTRFYRDMADDNGGANVN